MRLPIAKKAARGNNMTIIHMSHTRSSIESPGVSGDILDLIQCPDEYLSSTRALLYFDSIGFSFFYMVD